MTRPVVDRPPCRGSEDGTTLLELVVATAIGLALTALLSHALTGYRSTYRAAVSSLDRAHQARFALALISAELERMAVAPQSTGCPPPGLDIGDDRLEFTAALYDRETTLTAVVPAGASEVPVVATAGFESGDTVVVLNVGVVGDPSDDTSQCVYLTAVMNGRLGIVPTLLRDAEYGSPVVLVNRLRYRLDASNRLMRTQDGGTQRVADGVSGFRVTLDDGMASLDLEMTGGISYTRRLVVASLR